MKAMTRYLMLLAALLLIPATQADAKSYGGSGGSRTSSYSSKPSYSPSPSYSKPSYTPAASPSSFKPAPAPSYKPAPAPAPAPVAPAAAPKPAVQVNKSAPSSFAAAPAAPAPFVAKPVGAVDARTAQATATAGKTYASKADAEAAYKAKLAADAPKYTSPSAPATRPSYVPQSVNYGGHPVNVTYNHYGSGGYGYGYYDPTTHMFMALVAADLVLDAQRNAEVNGTYQQQEMLRQQQAAQLRAEAAQPVPVAAAAPEQPAQHGFAFYFLIACAAAGLIALLIWILF